MFAYSWMLYQSDVGSQFAVKVDTDLVADTSRGWAAEAGPLDEQLPRAWVCRRALGRAPNGQTRDAICASTTAPLWTGAAKWFTYRDSAGVFQTATVYKLEAERRLRIA